jgi:predicted enzyme related to lactoylglutathione lyase
MEVGMKLRFVYARAESLATSVAFYRDTLGWSEAWREGDDTVAFQLPESDVQVMVSTTDQPAGPMFLVESVDRFLTETHGLNITVKPFEIPDGKVVGIADPAGNTLYVFDQANVS